MKGGDFIKQYYTTIYPLKCNKTHYSQIVNLNSLSAEIWNECIRLDNIYLDVANHRLSRWDLQRLLKPIKNGLMSKNRQHVIKKYCQNRDDMWKSYFANHKYSNKVRVPYKDKKYYTTGWDGQSVKRANNYILLSKPIQYINGKKSVQKPYKCYIKNPPQNIAEVELIHKGNNFYLAVKYKLDESIAQIDSNNSASIDLGEIHSITSIDKLGNACIVTGRELRSIKHERNRHLSRLKSKRSKCKKNSKRWNKYNKAIQNLTWKYDKKILNATHKVSRLYANWCIVNQVKVIYYGDVDSATRNTKKRIGRFVGQKLNQWNYGELMRLLQNKLEKHGVKFVKVNEAYTSQTCPRCGERHKPSSRNYECKCGYVNHRDIVGAINILNFNETDFKIERYNKLEYLQITL